MFCTHCGKEIDENAVACPSCGAAVVQAAPAAEQAQLPARTAFCQHCGKPVAEEAVICTSCGCYTAIGQKAEKPKKTPKNPAPLNYVGFGLSLFAFVMLSAKFFIELYYWSSTLDAVWEPLALMVYGSLIGGFVCSLVSVARSSKKNVFGWIGLCIPIGLLVISLLCMVIFVIWALCLLFFAL